MVCGVPVIVVNAVPHMWLNMWFLIPHLASTHVAEHVVPDTTFSGYFEGISVRGFSHVPQTFLLCMHAARAAIPIWC